MKFGVIAPRGFPAFQEVAETIHYGLLSLGHDCVITKRWLTDRRLILFGSFSIPLLGVLPPRGTILYNLEQVFYGSQFITPTAVAIFRQYPMLDYNKRNIERLVKMGVPPPRYLPIGYVPEMTRIPPASEQDIDVLFYGSMDDRRRAVLDALRDRGLRVEATFGVFGRVRDGLIARSKVVLNMHGISDVFESVRVSYPLANKKAVVSERGDGHEDFEGGVAFADYGELVDRCAELVADDRARAVLAQRGFDLMASRSETEYLKSALVGVM